MKITEFSINNYGPLKSTGTIKAGAFNLFFGRNENGKTLTIDALIKLLTGKRAKDFDNVDRVEGAPDGYLKIEIDGAGEKTLPLDGDLARAAKSLPNTITPADCRNIFIIRNSDLSIEGETDFYTGVTDRLVGLRTFDLRKIKRNLLEIGKLTPAMDYRNDEKTLRLKSRMESAGKLIKWINDSRESLLKGKYDRLEIDLFRKSTELSAAGEMIRKYEEAKKRSMYEKSIELLTMLENKITSLKDMEIFRDEDLEAWQECEKEVKRSEREITDLRGNAASIKKEAAALESQAKELKEDLDIANSKRVRIDECKADIRALESGISGHESDSSLRALVKRVSIFSGIITLAIAASWFFNASVYLYIAGILSLLISAVLWIYEIYLNHKKSRVSEALGRIRISLAREGITGDTIEEILTSIGEFNSGYEKLRIRNNEFESRFITLQRHLQETEQKINERKAVSDDMEKKIYSLKMRCGLNTPQEYAERLKAKKSREKEKDALSNRLEGMLEVQGRSMGESLSRIKAKITELEPYRSKGRGIDFDENSFEEHRERKKTLESELQSLRDKKAQFDTGMARIETEASEIFIEDSVEGGERIICRTMADLDEVSARLNDFISMNSSIRDAAAAAGEIIEDIAKDENKRVLDLFDGKLSGLYSRITNGKYIEVIYDKESNGGKIRIKRDNGEIIDAGKLSGGAYDQLYLSIRLALGDKILHPGSGFFILDDPFIKSDIDRIKQQIEVLKKIRDMGWQILYFSCKNEIKDILSDDIKKGSVNYFDIRWVN